VAKSCLIRAKSKYCLLSYTATCVGIWEEGICIDNKDHVDLFFILLDRVLWLQKGTFYSNVEMSFNIRSLLLIKEAWSKLHISDYSLKCIPSTTTQCFAYRVVADLFCSMWSKNSTVDSTTVEQKVSAVITALLVLVPCSTCYFVLAWFKYQYNNLYHGTRTQRREFCCDLGVTEKQTKTKNNKVIMYDLIN
jgi:hypothetical protein